MIARLILFAALPLVSCAADPHRFEPGEDARAALSEAARSVLEAPDRVTLHSIDPNRYRSFGYGREDDPLARSLALLETGEGLNGSVEIEGHDRRVRLLTGLYDGFDGGLPALCYDPRHALVFRRGPDVVAIHLCFACGKAAVLEASTETGRYVDWGDEGLERFLNAELEAAGIPLSR